MAYDIVPSSDSTSTRKPLVLVYARTARMKLTSTGEGLTWDFCDCHSSLNFCHSNRNGPFDSLVIMLFCFDWSQSTINRPQLSNQLQPATLNVVKFLCIV